MAQNKSIPVLNLTNVPLHESESGGVKYFSIGGNTAQLPDGRLVKLFAAKRPPPNAEQITGPDGKTRYFHTLADGTKVNAPWTWQVSFSFVEAGPVKTVAPKAEAKRQAKLETAKVTAQPAQTASNTLTAEEVAVLRMALAKLA
jgi:hypothetical protein